MTRPPSSSPFAPDWPRADHKLQRFPATVPWATSVALLVSVAAGPLDVAALVCGEQSEFAIGTTAASVRAAAGDEPAAGDEARERAAGREHGYGRSQRERLAPVERAGSLAPVERAGHQAP
jgi:hypothetical protein